MGDKVLTENEIDFEKNETRNLMEISFQEVLAKFPDIDGFVIRTGETYVYDNPYH